MDFFLFLRNYFLAKKWNNSGKKQLQRISVERFIQLNETFLIKQINNIILN